MGNYLLNFTGNEINKHIENFNSIQLNGYVDAEGLHILNIEKYKNLTPVLLEYRKKKKKIRILDEDGDYIFDYKIYPPNWYFKSIVNIDETGLVKFPVYEENDLKRPIIEETLQPLKLFQGHIDFLDRPYLTTSIKGYTKRFILEEKNFRINNKLCNEYAIVFLDTDLDLTDYTNLGDNFPYDKIITNKLKFKQYFINLDKFNNYSINNLHIQLIKLYKHSGFNLNVNIASLLQIKK